MPRWLNALPLVLATATLSIIAASCNSTSQARIRFVHAIQDADALDIDFNSTKKITDIAFTNVQPSSGYIVVPNGLVTIEGFLASTETEAFSVSNVKLVAGNEYTVVATGFDVNTNGVIILSPVDNNTEPPNGVIDFRVINASPSSPGPLDIYIQQSQVQGLTPPATISAIPYEQTSKYLPEPYNTNGGGYTVYVCTAGSTIPIFSQNIPVGGSNEGSIRTLILTDQPNVDELNPQLVVLNDLN